MSSVSNGLYFLTLPLVSVMRVIYRKIRYFEVMERLCVRTNRVKNEQFPNKSWQLQLQLHHSRPGHCAFNVTQFPASKLTCVIQHPPYSPDLATAEYILFPKVKMVPKGERFSDISDMQCGVTELLKGVSLQDFSALSTTGINDLSVVSGVPRGGWGVQTPPRNSEGPPKSCQTQPDI